MKNRLDYMKNPGSTKIGRFLATKWHYFVVFAFGFVLCMGLWGHLGQFLLGDDAYFHIARLESASKAWSNGQIVPQVDPDALNGFGYAYNLFYGPAITYLTAGLKVLVGGWPIAINLALIICLILSGILMCRTMMKISNNPVLSALVAIFYMAAPYHLTDLYSRVAVGEVAALTVAPILVLGLYQLTNNESHAARNIAISAAFLILSHSLSAVLFALMAAVYIILNIDRVFNFRAIWRMVLGVLVALGLTAFFSLPLIDAKVNGNYGVFDEKYSEVFFGANVSSVNDHRAAPFETMLTTDYTKWPSLSIGLVALVGVIGFWLVWRRIPEKRERRFVISMYIIALLAFFMMSFAVDWNYLPKILLSIQFPWRFMMIFITAMSIVSGYVVRELTRGLTEPGAKVAVVVAGVLAVAPVISLLERTDNYVYEDQVEFAITSGALGWQAEYVGVEMLCDPEDWHDQSKGYACSLDRIPKLLKKRGNKPIADRNLKITNYHKDGLKVDFDVDTIEEITREYYDEDEQTKVAEEEVSHELSVELPMVYYPGYKATLDGTEVQVKSSEKYGLVEVELPENAHGEVKVWFGLSRPTLIGLLISVGTAILGIVWMIISGIFKLGKKKQNADAETLMASMRTAMEKLHKTNSGSAGSTKVAEKPTDAKKVPEAETVAKTTTKKVSAKTKTGSNDTKKVENE